MEKRKSKDNLVQIAIFGLIVVMLAIMGIKAVVNHHANLMGKPAPDFALKTYDGRTVRLSDYRGKVVLVNFWASWCHECSKEAPAVEAVWEKYRDKGVMVIGPAYMDQPDESMAFVAKYGLTYPVGLDVQGRIYQLYHVKGIPETFVIDRNGVVVGHIIGATTQEVLESEIEKAK